jgi:Ca-activated chloride channel homolog
MRLAEPAWLVLLILVPLPWLWERSRPRLAWPTLEGFGRAPRAPATWLRAVPALCRGAAIACLGVALARPQTVGGQTRVAGKGVAIVVALDQSSSMNAKAGPTTRLEAAKQTFARFVRGRPDDLIGLVPFANLPDLACPPTLNHPFLLDIAGRVNPAAPGDDGTNLGDAVAWGLAALDQKGLPARKVLILLTDGRNEPNIPDATDPEAAARMARDLGVTLHTIAVGRPRPADRPRESRTDLPLPDLDPGPDLDLLRRMADLGGGRSFVADDPGALDAVFATIDALEKSPVSGTIRTRYREDYAPFVAAAVALLALDRFLAGGRLRRLP